MTLLVGPLLLRVSVRLSLLGNSDGFVLWQALDDALGYGSIWHFDIAMLMSGYVRLCRDMADYGRLLCYDGPLLRL